MVGGSRWFVVDSVWVISFIEVLIRRAQKSFEIRAKYVARKIARVDAGAVVVANALSGRCWRRFHWWLTYRWRCQTGDVVKAANGQTATLIRKTPRENRAILEISVDDSKMRVTSSHRVLTPKDGGHVVPDVQRLRRSELDVFGCGACPIEP